MSPSENSKIWARAKYSILSHGDEILATDQYYNPIKDKWLPVEKEFVGQEWDSDHSKPVRRAAGKKSKNMGRVAIQKLEAILDTDYYHPVPEDACIAIQAVQSLIYKNFVK